MHSWKPWIAGWLLLSLGAGGALAQRPEAPAPFPRKIIATGWDSPTPARFRQFFAEFEKWPFDGTVIRPTRQKSGATVDATSAFGADHWELAEFASAIADLQAVHPLTAASNFLLLGANPGNVDWFDDAGWKEIVEHWRLLAKVAHDGGLKGLLYDGEPYSPPFRQFSYRAQPGRDKRSFAAYALKARERGRQVMRAVAGEYPNITILSYRLLCDLIPILAAQGDPAPLLEQSDYGLVPAFLDGWLDEIPPAATLVEGNENAYLYNSGEKFSEAYTRLKLGSAAFVSAENRAKLRLQYQVAHGFYLDAYVNDRSSSWFIDPLGQPPSRRLEANLSAALRASDGYVWVYGEKGRWWPAGDSPPWPEKFAHADHAVSRARDPAAFARQFIATAAPAANLLRNASFARQAADGQPSDWSFWERDTPKARHFRAASPANPAIGFACIGGAADASFGQDVAVQPGEPIVISVKVRRTGGGFAGAVIRWKTARGTWTALDQDVNLSPLAPPDADGWLRCLAYVRVPQAEILTLLLVARGQETADEVASFAEAQVFRAAD